MKRTPLATEFPGIATGLAWDRYAKYTQSEADIVLAEAELWLRARARKDYTAADKHRALLIDAGVILETVGYDESDGMIQLAIGAMRESPDHRRARLQARGP